MVTGKGILITVAAAVTAVVAGTMLTSGGKDKLNRGGMFRNLFRRKDRLAQPHGSHAATGHLPTTTGL